MIYCFVDTTGIYTTLFEVFYLQEWQIQKKLQQWQICVLCSSCTDRKRKLCTVIFPFSSIYIGKADNKLCHYFVKQIVKCSDLCMIPFHYSCEEKESLKPFTRHNI